MSKFVAEKFPMRPDYTWLKLQTKQTVYSHLSRIAGHPRTYRAMLYPDSLDDVRWRGPHERTLNGPRLSSFMGEFSLASPLEAADQS